ncbi:MAG: type IX secretion system protein PorQ [Chitinophagia bacterium]
MRRVVQQLRYSAFIIIFITFFVSTLPLRAQQSTANEVYQFLTLPYSAKATSLGGINISHLGSDLGLAMYNPALLDPSMDKTLHLSVKSYFSNIQQYDFSGANYLPKKNWILGWGIHYMGYGNIKMTDVSGNEMGNFLANDYVAQVSMATLFRKNINLAATLKFINSNYGVYKSTGLAMDLSMVYTSSSNLLRASILANNIGGQLSSYTEKERLPLNIIMGVSKKLENAPIEFSITAQRLSIWNNTFYDPGFYSGEGYKAPSATQDIFNHLIIGAEANLGEQVSLDFGYNFIRRFDLNIQNQQNWFNGFSAGLGLKLPRVTIQYGNAFFQRNLYHHFSIFYSLKNER